MLQTNWLYSRHAVWLILLVLFAVLLFQLGAWGVLETSEARYAEISREMLVSGDWVHPRLLGILHFHKPPVTYLITAAGMGLFGINGFGARFFLQVSFVLQAGLVYALACLLFKNRKIAVTALIIYATLPAVLISARNLTTDSFLAMFELLAIWAWVKYKMQGKPGFLILFFVALALAFLTKGPVGLLFPVLVAIALIGWGNGTANKAYWALGLLVFLGLGSSWYLYLMLQDHRLVDYFFWRQTVERFANPEAFNRSQPWWYYLVLAPLLSLPWSLILVVHLHKLKKLSKAYIRLFALWIAVPLLFFSFSGSKLILYILPLFAGLSLLIAWLLDTLEAPQARRSATIGALFYVSLALAFLVGPFLPLGISFPWASFLFPLGMIILIISVGQRQWENTQRLLVSALGFVLLLVPFSTYLLAFNAPMLPGSQPLAYALQEKELAHRQVVVYDRLLPSLAFEQNRNFISVHDKNQGMVRETQFETNQKWRNHYLQCTQAEDSVALAKMLREKTVLVVKGDLPQNRKWLLSYFQKRKKVGAWDLHY
jgi:hypothetical protein